MGGGKVALRGGAGVQVGNGLVTLVTATPEASSVPVGEGINMDRASLR